MHSVKIPRRWIFTVIPLAAFFWLIFFPNAPYILTDFQHLANPSGDLPVWYDVMILFSYITLYTFGHLLPERPNR
jgi:uncharacterized membrane protein